MAAVVLAECARTDPVAQQKACVRQIASRIAWVSSVEPMAAAGFVVCVTTGMCVWTGTAKRITASRIVPTRNVVRMVAVAFAAPANRGGFARGEHAPIRVFRIAGTRNAALMVAAAPAVSASRAIHAN